MSDTKPENKNKPADLSELQAKLDAANALLEKRDKEILEAKEALEAQRDSSSQRPLRVATEVVKGEGYRFRVGLKKPHPGLPDVEVECCDESEAIRWFILTKAHPDKPGVQIDPSVYPLQAKCVDPRRDDRIKRDKVIGGLRSKAERGQILSEVEQALLDEADEKVLSI